MSEYTNRDRFLSSSTWSPSSSFQSQSTPPSHYSLYSSPPEGNWNSEELSRSRFPVHNLCPTLCQPVCICSLSSNRAPHPYYTHENHSEVIESAENNPQLLSDFQNNSNVYPRLTTSNITRTSTISELAVVG
jgi:hypothetical protein